MLESGVPRVTVNVDDLLAISTWEFDNSGRPEPQSKGVNHLETPLRQLHITYRASSCAKRGCDAQLCSKPRGARGIEPETLRRRGQLLSCPQTTGPNLCRSDRAAGAVRSGERPAGPCMKCGLPAAVDTHAPHLPPDFNRSPGASCHAASCHPPSCRVRWHQGIQMQECMHAAATRTHTRPDSHPAGQDIFCFPSRDRCDVQFLRCHSLSRLGGSYPFRRPSGRRNGWWMGPCGLAAQHWQANGQL